MSRWPNGSGEIEHLLARRHLERVSGARADGAPWLGKAARRLDTAKAIVVTSNPRKSSRPSAPLTNY
jgi:hypothetical protein